MFGLDLSLEPGVLVICGTVVSFRPGGGVRLCLAYIHYLLTYLLDTLHVAAVALCAVQLASTIRSHPLSEQRNEIVGNYITLELLMARVTDMRQTVRRTDGQAATNAYCGERAQNTGCRQNNHTPTSLSHLIHDYNPELCLRSADKLLLTVLRKFVALSTKAFSVSALLLSGTLSLSSNVDPVNSSVLLPMR